MQWILKLNAIGIPKGSVLKGAKEIAVGTLEGLAYYLNGTELSDEVYQNCDINYVIEQMEAKLQGIGRMGKGKTESGAETTGKYLLSVKGFPNPNSGFLFFLAKVDEFIGFKNPREDICNFNVTNMQHFM